jgi:hypothetical protein
MELSIIFVALRMQLMLWRGEYRNGRLPYFGHSGTRSIGAGHAGSLPPSHHLAVMSNVKIRPLSEPRRLSDHLIPAH